MNRCVVCQAQSHHTVYDKTTGTTVPVCMSHSNMVFEYGTGSFDRDTRVRAGLNTALTGVGKSVKVVNLKGGLV